MDITIFIDTGFNTSYSTNILGANKYLTQYSIEVEILYIQDRLWNYSEFTKGDMVLI